VGFATADAIRLLSGSLIDRGCSRETPGIGPFFPQSIFAGETYGE